MLEIGAGLSWNHVGSSGVDARDQFDVGYRGCGPPLFRNLAREGAMRKTLMLFAVIAGCASFVGRASADPVDDLQPGHWLEAPDSHLDVLDPCPARDCSYSAVEGVSAVMNDWNGGAFATGYGDAGGLVVFGGGHNGYFGNELYVFDIGTLSWARATDPVDNPVCNQTTGELQDGSPCSAHTYDYVDYHPGTNSFVELGSASNHEAGGGGSPRVHLFSFDTNQWRAGDDTYDNFLSHTGASSAYDPTRDVFWVVPAYNRPFAMYDPNANGGLGAWTQYNDFNIDIDALSAVDPIRDILVTLDCSGSHTVIVHDLKNPTDPGVTVTTVGDRALEDSNSPGFEWDPVTEQFVGWQGGAEVYTLEAGADWRQDPWTWLRVDAAPSNTETPGDANPNGTYSRFRYIPAKNAYVVANRTDENVFIYKLSEGGGTAGTGGSAGSGGAGGTGGSAGGTGGTGGTSGTGGASGGSAGAPVTTIPDSSDDGGCSCRLRGASFAEGEGGAMFLLTNIW